MDVLERRWQVAASDFRVRIVASDVRVRINELTPAAFFHSRLTPYSLQHVRALELEWGKFCSGGEQEAFVMEGAPGVQWEINFLHMSQRNTHVSVACGSRGAWQVTRCMRCGLSLRLYNSFLNFDRLEVSALSCALTATRWQHSRPNFPEAAGEWRA